jgi:7-cyano-7-deazaguanine synthase
VKAVVLLSGGLDSTVVLAHALSKSRECLAVTFDYRQRNQPELEAAKLVASHYGVQHKMITICANTFALSSLVSSAQVPKDRSMHQIYHGGIPNTYVPGRNTLFLAYAMGQAEIFNAQEIYFGINMADLDGYPDARPAYIQAFQALLNLATKQALEGLAPQIVVPLIKWHKRDIVKHGIALKAPLQLTMSCYDPFESIHCGRCDACYLRKEGFIAARQKDPTTYAEQGLPLGAAELGEILY